MAGMPPPPPRPPGDLLRAALLSAAGGGGGPRQPGAGEGAAPPRDPALPLPLPWRAYFDRRVAVPCPDRGATFNAYLAGDSGPVVLCLHGGGYTGLTWALLAARLKGRCRVVAPDLRGHGATRADVEGDLSAATLAADVQALWRALFAGGGAPADAQQRGGAGAAPPPHAPPSTVLVGHSMGGAIAVHAAALAGIPSLAGLVVVDVVEGTALASLPHMAAVLQRRPTRFATLRDAVDWALGSGTCRRQEAAHVSLPDQLVRVEGTAGEGGGGGGGGGALTPSGLEPLAEEEEEEDEGEEGGPSKSSAQPQAAGQPGRRAAGPPADGPAGTSAAPQSPARQGDAPAGGWAWRTPLAASERHWEGWYRGLSDLFLRLPVPKVLVLAGTDRLDRPLTIGQMQGRFQPVLLPQAGHAVHEDEPEHVAEAIATFMARFRIGEPPLQVPRPAPGVPRVLPVAMGPAFTGPAAAAPAAGQR